MDQLDAMIADRLAVRGDRYDVPDDLAGRVVRAVGVRRRRRRRAVVAGTALAVAVILAAPAVGMLGQDAAQPATTPAPTAQSRPTLQALVDLSATAAIKRDLPGGWLLQAGTLGSDGTVVGVGVREDGEWEDRMWAAGPQDPVPRPVPGPEVSSAASFPAVTGHTLFWVESRDEPYDLFVLCTDLGQPGRVSQLGDSGMLKGFVPVIADNGIGIWTDQGRDLFGDQDSTNAVSKTVWAATACDAEPTAVATDGYAVAFSHPHVFVRPFADGDELEAAPSLQQVDVETGRIIAEIPLPQTVAAQDEHTAIRFATNATTIAWTDGEALTIADRQDGTTEQVATDLPVAKGVSGTETRLSAGNRVVAYSSVPILDSGDPSSAAQSIVYDIRSGEQWALQGLVYASGDWLLWHPADENQAVYHVGRVRD